MCPIAMALLMVVLFGTFAYTMTWRWRLMVIGPSDIPLDQPAERMRRMVLFALGQWRMPRHPLAGLAHIFIYLGAVVMLLRALILFARGFVSNQHFGYWLFDTGAPLGDAYALIKDVFVALVLIGVAVFFYYRVLKRLKRMTLNFEGLLILAILTTLMLSDVLYDGANIVRHDEAATFNVWEPLGSLAAIPLRDASEGTIMFLQHLGFWTHVSVILLFMNILPYTKQFHEMTAFPNVYVQNLNPPGRLPPLVDIEGMLEREETLGIKRIDQFGWNAILDFYTCTECGRCKDQCPASNTGKKLAPKDLTVDLRDFLYGNDRQLVAAKAKANDNGETSEDNAPQCHKDLVDGIIDPEVLWACTTCRACEQECPVFISYVDKIVNMRRYLVQERGEFPNELQTAFRSLESAGNPFGFPADERGAWAQPLGVKTLADHPDAEVLFWVGCMPSFDDRAKKVTTAMATLMQQAGVDFAILGAEETCTGDAARRAGNEYLFQMLAQQNIETLNRYAVEKKLVVTTCPHCYNTLKNEYPDFGGHYNVIHHSEFLADLIAKGKLKPTQRVDKTITFHDSCYLGRYNDIYDAPRNTLTSVPGVTLVEPEQTKDRGMCCGAGGAQMFKEEEEGDDRINNKRTDQLLATHPDAIANACPFCTRMIMDGLADKEREELPTLDIAEVLLESIDDNH